MTYEYERPQGSGKGKVALVIFIVVAILVAFNVTRSYLLNRSPIPQPQSTNELEKSSIPVEKIVVNTLKNKNIKRLSEIYREDGHCHTVIFEFTDPANGQRSLLYVSNLNIIVKDAEPPLPMK